MIAAPAVDLRGGRCVQLVGGRPEDERVSLPDPVAVAERWWQAGFGTLHFVDLDAALGDGDNLDVLRKLLAATPAETQVGGGVRDGARIDALLEAGADRIIVGTKAIDDMAWLAMEAGRNPGRLMLALDHRDGQVLRKGWTEESGLSVDQLMSDIAELPLAGVLSTDVGREGRMEGIDREAVAHVVEACLEEQQAAGAVLGMALYTETLDPAAVAPRWGGSPDRAPDDDTRGTSTASPTKETP